MAEDKRQNEIIRIQKKRNNFVLLDKGFIDDIRLSLKAKGLLAYLLSKPDNWTVIVRDIVNHCKDGKASVYSGLRELKNYGYYKKIPIRDESGRRISHWESVIFECPEENTGFNDKQDPQAPQGEASENSLPPKNQEVAKSIGNTTLSLLTDFQYIENEYIENEDIENRQHNNNNINKNDFTNNLSHSQRQVINGKTDKTNDFDYDVDHAEYPFSRYEKEPLLSAHEPPATAQKKVSAFESIPSKYRQAETENQNRDNLTTYERIIQENIDYQFIPIIQRDFVDSLIGIMLDVIVTQNPTVKIGGEIKPREIVKAVYLKLTREHMEYVIDQYQEQNHRINHKIAYLRTALYNSCYEITAHYENRVRSDDVIGQRMNQ